MSAASGSPSKGPSQVAYGIALAAALSVEDPFMQTDNLQVSLMVMRLGSGRRACPSACALSLVVLLRAEDGLAPTVLPVSSMKCRVCAVAGRARW